MDRAGDGAAVATTGGNATPWPLILGLLPTRWSSPPTVIAEQVPRSPEWIGRPANHEAGDSNF